MKKSPFYQISTRQELADALNMRLKSLSYVLYKLDPQSLYTIFSISKKSGGKREITAPKKPLANIQSKIANVLMLQPENSALRSKASHGFIKNKSILTNATVHRNKNYVLNTDIQDFFPSFSFGRVLGFFKKNNAFMMDHKVAVALTNLCCYKKKLPQGAPSSPPITNLIFHIVDFKIIKLARKYNLDYTRYVDDLTFSTNEKSFPKVSQNFLNELNALITHEGFKLNEDKTHLEYKNSRQEVTGVIVNKKLNVHKEFYKNTRAMADNLYKNTEFTIDGKLGTINQLDGRFNYINQLVRYNKKSIKRKVAYKTKYNVEKKDFNHQSRFTLFSGKEQQYRKFLFYEYFIYGSSSIILTEGKTDVSYIKLALRVYKQEYPQLITSHGKKTEYSVSFLKHTQNTSTKGQKKGKKNNQMSHRIPYFIGISEDGGTSIDNFLNYYSEISTTNLNMYPNYPKYFISDLGKLPDKKVIILLDNEKGQGSPLNAFENKCCSLGLKEKGKIENDIKDKGYSHIKYNLFLLVIPCVNSQTDCCVEDLLNQQQISKLELNGKHFCKSNKFDINKFFGKQALLSCVISSFSDKNKLATKFDLSGFKLLLSKISEINSLKAKRNLNYEYKYNPDNSKTPKKFQNITVY
ncbi:retron Ec67 family RNA-directed DNA polymerase/endonuclease [Levilactobacillus brevis]|jgi:hypothetical protein|uniref:retron Ec67 family RNA-directed DNA polymerase/endonuclease n=1 Tax=Lactobacillaceae TaxID=33958 RepID=UPI00211B837B|nr:retron Ec67 family RNA-directed DNA polymerase/endonuclease [Pediococcus pentosaceus]MCQ9316968.1 retron Ec67 family RNA-directed DNA polymerase/endonuclease [Pediococcus pentosaceus]MCQ9339509.1 retron Ec67 family RNA-directed DNA polymerase/endonuclease [Pediococcus pentosaceus]